MWMFTICIEYHKSFKVWSGHLSMGQFVIFTMHIILLRVRREMKSKHKTTKLTKENKRLHPVFKWLWSFYCWFYLCHSKRLCEWFRLNYRVVNAMLFHFIVAIDRIAACERIKMCKYLNLIELQFITVPSLRDSEKIYCIS